MPRENTPFSIVPHLGTRCDSARAIGIRQASRSAKAKRLATSISYRAGPLTQERAGAATTLLRNLQPALPVSCYSVEGTEARRWGRWLSASAKLRVPHWASPPSLNTGIQVSLQSAGRYGIYVAYDH
jgi:hypothetical protein